MLLLKRIYVVFILLFIHIFLFVNLFAQQVSSESSSWAMAVPPLVPGSLRTDSLFSESPSVLSDSLPGNSSQNPLDSVASTTPKRSPLDEIVTYEAADSMVFMGNNNAFLYGSSVVTYQDVELDAQEIRMNLDSSTVFANGVPDSVGTLVGTPVFKDKSGEYESKTIDDNFKSQKGYGTLCSGSNSTELIVLMVCASWH